MHMDTVDVPKCCGDETIKQQPNPTVSCTCRDRLVLERQHRRGVAAVQRRGTPCFKQLQCVLYLIIIISTVLARMAVLESLEGGVHRCRHVLDGGLCFSSHTIPKTLLMTVQTLQMLSSLFCRPTSPRSRRNGPSSPSASKASPCRRHRPCFLCFITV